MSCGGSELAVLIAGRDRHRDWADPVRELVMSATGRQLQVVVAPRAVDLPDGHELFASLAEIEADLVVAAELYPRAAFWWLHRHGVRGQARLDGGESENDGNDGAQQASPEPSRTIYCIDLRRCSSASDLAQRIAELVESEHAPASRLGQDAAGTARAGSGGAHVPADTAVAHSPGVSASVSVVETPERHRWYPVIDYDRCTHCLECLEFCLFGVYDVDDEERVIVAEPDECRDGCPACSRVCPELAIIFPKHKSAAIGGGSVKERNQLKLDLSDLLGSITAKEQANLERERAVREAQAKDSSLVSEAELVDKNQQDQPRQPARDELDELIDSVEE